MENGGPAASGAPLHGGGTGTGHNEGLPAASGTAATAALPYGMLQSAGVACPLIMVSTLQKSILLAESLGVSTLSPCAAGAFGHSQGLASAGIVSMLQHAAREAPALLMQGLLEQQQTGLSTLTPQKKGSPPQPPDVGMLGLAGRATPRMQLAMRLGRTSIINSEANMIHSGPMTPGLMEKISSPAWQKAGMQGSVVPMPFAPHSITLEPAFHQLEERLRTLGLPGKSSACRFPVQQTSMAVVPRGRTPQDAWRNMRAMQMTMNMDFPGTAEASVANTNPTVLMDCGPTSRSVSSKLLARSLNNIELVTLVAPSPTGTADGDAGLVARVREAAAKVAGVSEKADDEAPLASMGLTSQRVVSFHSKLLGVIPECAGKLRLADIFSSTNIKELASVISRYLGSNEEVGVPHARSRVLPRISKVFAVEGASLPLSHQQEMMLRIQYSNPLCTAFNVSSSVWIAGGVNPEWLQTCVEKVLMRHEIFSSTASLSERSLKLRSVVPRVTILKVADEVAALARMGEVGKFPFDLSSEASIRVEIAVLPSGLVLLIVWAHHMNFDTISQGCFYRDLYLLLSCREKELPHLPVQYVDYAHWSRRCFEFGEIDPAPALDALLPSVGRSLDLPLDLPRPAKWTYRGDCVTTVLPVGPEFPHTGITPFIGYLTAFFIQLWKLTGQQTVWIGVPYHGRDQDEVKDLCGNFSNLVCVEGEVNRGVTVSEAVQNIKRAWHRAMEHSNVPFLHLVDAMHKDAGANFDGTRHPVVQAFLNYRVDSGEAVADGRFRRQPVHQMEGLVDLEFVIDKGPGGVIITMNYSTDLFLPRTAERFAAQYLACLKAVSMKEWAQVECWRIPYAPSLIDDVTQATSVTPEIMMQNALPKVAKRLHRPGKFLDRDFLPVR